MALLILGMKIILHTFKTLVETFHGTSLPPKIIRQFSNAELMNHEGAFAEHPEGIEHEGRERRRRVSRSQSLTGNAILEVLPPVIVEAERLNCIPTQSMGTRKN
jgi:hypothetical protein